jgi:hypothetical protein
MVAEEYESFVVRIWRKRAGDENAERWCGEIEQIQSGVRWRFCTMHALLTFLQQAADRPTTTVPTDLEQPLNEATMTSHY